MSSSVVSVSGIGKAYTVPSAEPPAAQPSLLRRISARIGLPQPSPTNNFWALRNVSFDLKAGERVGIIGRNGAGKSTLLKILSRVTQPTEGTARLRGRVSSLLEVGTGFHPDLSGRDNVYLNAAMLGMSRAEVARVFDEIVDYAGVERFIDAPLKHYSSGMSVRLAFAVASYLDPEIMIIDEVLAVGDAAFQRKSIGRINDISREGRTILFVSHAMSSVRSLCNRAIYIHGGTVVADGDVGDVIEQYIESTVTQADSAVAVFPDNPEKIAVIRRVAVVSDQGAAKPHYGMDDQIIIEIDYVLHKEVRDGMAIFAVSRDGTPIFQTHDSDLDEELLMHRAPGYYRARIPLPRGLLTAGVYSIYPAFAVGRAAEYGHDGHADAVTFTIHEHDQEISIETKGWSPARGNLIVVRPSWSTERLGPGSIGWGPEAGSEG